MEVSEILLTLAEVPHIFSVVVVTTVCLLLLTLILRFVDGDVRADVASVTRMKCTSPAANLKRAHFPCWLNAVSSSSDACKIVLGCCEDHRVIVRGYWGVKVTSFYRILQAPWALFTKAHSLPDENLFGADGCVEKGTIEEWFPPPDSTTLSMELKMASGAEGLKLGSAPRRAYPLVLVALAEPATDQCPGHLLGALIVVFHVQDELCRIATHPIATFVKLSSHGQVIRMMPMYSHEECVVCKEALTLLCLLPCKHACVCRSCFKHLSSRCPICRSFIQSYFQLGEEEQEEAPVLDGVPADRTVGQRILHFVTSAFGAGGNR